MNQNNNNMHELIHSNNLPTSFDVTRLLSKVEHLEKDDSRGNILSRVKLMELDPYHHHHHPPRQQTATEDKTRLFLAVAFGKNVVVAQLVALELGRDAHAAHDNNDDNNRGEGGLDGDDEELEWMDVSDERVLIPRRGNQSDESVGDPTVVTVFPPSCADSLSTPCLGAPKIDHDTDGIFTAEIITSCALIPSPAVRTVCSTSNSRSKMITQRMVALMLGTVHDQVLSLLLNVSESEPMDNNNIRFRLEYDECKIIENGKLKEQGSKAGDSLDPASYPCVNQILPHAKRFVPENNGNGDATHNNGGKDHEGKDSNLDEHIQVIHPSLAHLNNDSHNEKGDGQREEKYSGIKSISFCRDNWNPKRFSYGASMNKEEGQAAIMNQDIIWITYGNGTIVKLPSWKPFLAFGSIAGGSVDSSDVLVNGSGTEVLGDGSSVIPLNSPFHSPLDIPPPQLNHHTVLPDDENKTITQGPDIEEYWTLLSSAVSSQDPSLSHINGQQQNNANNPPVQALVLAGPSAPASTLPIAFNSSRVKCDPASALAQEETASDYGSAMQHGDQEVDISSDEEDHYGPGTMTGTVVEGTAALVKGALGVAFGAMRWGLGGRSGVTNLDEEDDTPLDEFMDVDDTVDDDFANHDMATPLEHHPENTQKINGHDPFMKREAAMDLFPWPLNSASFPFSDIPRRFETATVDPSGSLVATTDNLGRVILFDLETNQPIRMWKGMRNCTCYFAELPCYDGRNTETGTSTRSYLVIHLRQRGAVEVYRLRQGPRVSAIAVPQQKDCVVVECHGPPSEGSRVDSFLLERIDESEENQSEGCHYIIDKLVIDDPDAVVATALPKQTPARPVSQSENKMQLKLLMQLLAPDTNIQFSSQTVLTTFKSIRALADLGEGLDALSKCDHLEREMGIDCSNLHSQAVWYCKSRLNHAKDVESEEGSGMVRKAVISELSLKLAYHERLGHAYCVLHGYESKNDINSTTGGDDQEGGGDSMEKLSPWASESLSWISAASKNDALKHRFMQSFPNAQNQGDKKPLEFSKFAMACQSSGDNDRVYLTKVKRSRLPILRRIFRPLLQDLFVFKVVNSLFGHLGILGIEDFDTLQKYLGEWMTMVATDIAKSNMSGTWRPMVRWLQDLILNAYDISQQEQQTLDDDFLRKTAKLESLMKFCMEMEDLPKAFLLAVICMEAVSSASIQLELKTYGKITQLESVQPWEDLLRKLRVCLLVSLRLAGDVSPTGGIEPLTVSSVSRPDIFSVYSWIARDELSLSHDNQVVIALESACLSSSLAFYPSTVDGDSTRRKKTIFLSCNDPRQGVSLRNPTGLTNDTNSRSLLFFLKDHARFTPHLAANRALILASLWGKTPEHLYLLKHAISALRTVVDRVEGFSLAVLVEIYQSRIRPVCRAMLFGFGEHELSEDVVSPLIEDPVWLCEFITVVKQILSMIIECMSKMPSVNASKNLEPSEMWPPLRECPVLNVLVRKLRDVQLQLSSVELHHTIFFAFEMTRSIESLESVVPSFASLFLIGTLFSEMPPMPKGSIQQKGLLDKAIVDHAEKTSGPVVDNFTRINDVVLFAKALGLDAKYVRTQYLIEMIRLGKDTSINDLLGASSPSLDRALFAEKVVQIICSRLNATITSLKSTKNYRGILSLLDADASRWVREEAAKCSPSQQHRNARASLITTYSMAMRVQSMSESLDNSLSAKSNALSLMSGTLLKAVQAQEQEAVMSV